MKPAAVDYVRPRDLSEVFGLLAGTGIEARVIAGGQSLMALMNLRIAAPDLLIDIARLPELTAVDEDREAVGLGACVTHAAIEDGSVPDPSRGLMPHVAAGLAYRAIRNRGTLGGSLALADPAAEWPAVLTALGAEVVVAGANGRRSVDCAAFATGVFETRLEPGEIVAGVRIPKASATARWGYVKFCRKSGEFAQALAVALHDPARAHSRVVVGAANGPPLVLAASSNALASGDRAEAARQAIAADLDRAADRRFDAFQRNLHQVAAWRAIRQATA
jgi:carbon-monoxide dehydrogenase medium subunit